MTRRRAAIAHLRAAWRTMGDAEGNDRYEAAHERKLASFKAFVEENELPTTLDFSIWLSLHWKDWPAIKPGDFLSADQILQFAESNGA